MSDFPGDAHHFPVTAQRVVACVVRRDAKYLVCQRPAHKRHGGLWEFPGGKIEPGESDARAAERELAEELGLRLLSSGNAIFERVDAGSHYVIAFVPVEVSGELNPSEHAATFWGSPAGLLRLPLAPSDRAFVEFLSISPAVYHHG